MFKSHQIKSDHRVLLEKLSRYLWSMLLFVYSPPTKNSAVDSLGCHKKTVANFIK